MPEAEQIRATVAAYVDAYARNDKEAFLALWTAAGVLEDPVGTPVQEGIAAIGAFWDTARQMADRIVLEPQQVIAAGDEAVMVMEVHAHVGDSEMVIPVVDIMRVDDDGRLVSVRAFWNMGG
jgi:steroid delta-isomerase